MRRATITGRLAGWHVTVGTEGDAPLPLSGYSDALPTEGADPRRRVPHRQDRRGRRSGIEPRKGDLHGRDGESGEDQCAGEPILQGTLARRREIGYVTT
jgi:hypothetical protein